jgi:hypothetical protein
MDDELLKKLIEIVKLDDENLSQFGYNSLLGLYDPAHIEVPLQRDLTSEFHVGNKYFKFYCNNEITEFYFIRIDKLEYDRLTEFANSLDE